MGFIEPTKKIRKISTFSWIILLIIAVMLVCTLVIKKTDFFEKDMGNSQYLGEWVNSQIAFSDGYTEEITYDKPEIRFNDDGTGEELYGDKPEKFYWRQYNEIIIYVIKDSPFGGGYFFLDGDDSMYNHRFINNRLARQVYTRY